MPTLPEVLSPERYGTYLGWASQDHALAKRLYTYNVQLSAALYGPLHMVEVALRNVTDRQLVATQGSGWLDDPQVLRSLYQQGCVAKARHSLQQEGKTASHGQMVAELNFGFWCSLFGREGSHLWGGVLRPIFQTGGLQRGKIAGELKDIRTLRNRVAHYEPILALPLDLRYASITALTGWLSPSAAAWIHQYSTWPALYPSVPIIVQDQQTGVYRVSGAVLPYLPT